MKNPDITVIVDWAKKTPNQYLLMKNDNKTNIQTTTTKRSEENANTLDPGLAS